MGKSRKKLSFIVTGGSGFVGKSLIEKLSAQSKVIYCLDKKFSKNYKFPKNVKKIKVDLKNYKDLKKKTINIKKIDIVIHTAAKQPFSKENNLQEYINANVIGTGNLLNICEEKKFLKIIACSSFSVYGKPDKLPIKENHDLNPINTYGLSKVLAENLYKFYSKNRKFKIIILRFDGIFGYKQNLPGFIEFATKKILKKEKFEVFANGNLVRDQISVDDVVSIIIKSVKYIKNFNHIIFNAGSGQPKKTKKILNIIFKDLKMKSNIKYTKKLNPNFNYNTFMDISKAKKYLKFNPYSLKKSISIMLNKIKNES